MCDSSDGTTAERARRCSPKAYSLPLRAPCRKTIFGTEPRATPSAMDVFIIAIIGVMPTPPETNAIGRVEPRLSTKSPFGAMPSIVSPTSTASCRWREPTPSAYTQKARALAGNTPCSVLAQLTRLAFDGDAIRLGIGHV